jgi:hypothetical protein
MFKLEIKPWHFRIAARNSTQDLTMRCKKSVQKIQEHIHEGANLKFYIPEFFNFKVLIPEYSPIYRVWFQTAFFYSGLSVIMGSVKEVYCTIKLMKVFTAIVHKFTNFSALIFLVKFSGLEALFMLNPSHGIILVFILAFVPMTKVKEG